MVNIRSGTFSSEGSASLRVSRVSSFPTFPGGTFSVLRF